MGKFTDSIVYGILDVKGDFYAGNSITCASTGAFSGAVTAPIFNGVATKVSNNLIIQLNGGTTEGTNKTTFNGETSKTINITPSNIGAVSTSGSGASGTWGISISGNAATASSANAVAWGNVSSKPNTLSGYGITDAPTKTGGGASGTWGISISGNAASSTKLQTTRSINGTNFDGSANITTANWGTARNLTIGSTAKSVNGSANVAWTLAEIGAAPASHTHSYLPLSGGSVTGRVVVGGSIGNTYGVLTINTAKGNANAGINIWDGNETTSRIWLHSNNALCLSRGENPLAGLGIFTNGNVSIGKTSNEEKLDVGGNIKAELGYFDSIRLGGKTFYNVASRTHANSTETGIIKIAMPFGWINNMGTYEVDIYEYNGTAHSKIIVSGYNFSGSGGSWVNSRATIIGDLSAQVRLGYDGAKCCILIGSTNTTWAYTQVYVTKATIGFSYNSDISRGWSVSLITTETGLSGVLTPTIAKMLSSNNYNNYSPTKTGGGASGTWGISISGNAATASSVAWGNVSGKPTSFTPAEHTHTFASLTSKPTTISGYGITDAPTKTGSGASGTWGISISGNAATASSANAVAWGNVSSKPTTLSGYGITDAPTKTGSGASGTWGVNVTGYSQGIASISSSITSGAGSRISYSYNIQASTTGLFPSTNNANAVMTVNTHSGEFWHQLGFSSNGKLYSRMFAAKGLDTSRGWDEISFASHTHTFASLTSKPTTISGYGITDAPTKTGGGASGTWGISISGNAATASSVAWGNVSGKPTTISGYGITDAPTKTGSGASGTWGISISGNAATASKVSTTVAAGVVGELVKCTMADNDYFRIAVGGGTNAGYAEIATADDSNEPIHVRQYGGNFVTVTRTATLLDASGNTIFPGTVTSTGFKKTSSSDSYVLLGGGGHKSTTSSGAVSSIVERDSAGDINARLYRSTYGNQDTISGGIVFRINNSTDNYLRTCSSPSAIRTWLSAAASDHTHYYIPNRGRATASDLASTYPNGISMVETYNSGFPVMYGNVLNLKGNGDTQLVIEWSGNQTTSNNAITTNMYVRSRRDNLTAWTDFTRICMYGQNIGTSASNYAAGNHTHTFASLTSKPTTISGYGITDAPTKTGGGASGTWGISISGSAASASNSNTVGGLSVHTSRNNEANKIVRTNGNGYLEAGWINTTSGGFNSGNERVNRIYCSDDEFIRQMSPAEFKRVLGLWHNGNLNNTTTDFTCRNLNVAGSVNQTSSIKYKTDIVKFEQRALDIIEKVNVVNYKYKTHLNINHIGFIAEDTPKELSTDKQNVMDIGSCVGVLLKAVQELTNEIKQIKNEQ